MKKTVLFIVRLYCKKMTVYVKITTVYDRGDCNIYLEYVQLAYSTCIRVADGWTNYPSRYVWGACYGTWKYVVVIPD